MFVAARGGLPRAQWEVSMSAAAIQPLPAVVTQEHITGNTPMGANLIANGATFRVWAPGARRYT